MTTDEPRLEAQPVSPVRMRAGHRPATEDARPAPGSGAAVSWGGSLTENYNPRSNSMDVLRLVFAGMVAVAHALAIGAGWQPTIGGTQIAALAVDGFFVLSGFLITASFLRLPPGRFLWHRFLRIMPAFWACLIITAVVVAPIVAALEGLDPGSVFTGENASWKYVAGNAALYMTRFDVAGLPLGTYQPQVINGALWTLFYEVVCYLMVFALGLIGGLTRHRWLTWTVAVISTVALILPMAGVDLPGDLFWRFFLIFTLGMLGWLYRDRIPITRTLTCAAVVLLLVSMLILPDYRPLGGVAFAYLCLVAMVATPRLRKRLTTDVSYGLYVWHWPVQVILVLAGALEVMPTAVYVALSVALATAAAWISWHGLEKHALAAKNYRRGT